MSFASFSQPTDLANQQAPSGGGGSAATDATLLAIFNNLGNNFTFDSAPPGGDYDGYGTWAAENDGNLKLEDASISLNARSSTVNFGPGYVGGDSTITVADGSQFQVGDIIKQAGDPELIRVTAISTNNLTCHRGYSTTNAVAINHGVTLNVVGSYRPIADGRIEITATSPFIPNAALLTALAVDDLTIMFGVECESGVDFTVKIESATATNTAVITVSEDNQVVLTHKRDGTAGAGDAFSSSLADAMKVFRAHFPKAGNAEVQVNGAAEQAHTSAAGDAALATSGGAQDDYEIIAAGGIANLGWIAFFDGDVHAAQEATIRALATDSPLHGGEGEAFYAIGE